MDYLEKTYDALVGGGNADFCAAISAAENGSNVFLCNA